LPLLENRARHHTPKPCGTRTTRSRAIDANASADAELSQPSPAAEGDTAPLAVPRWQAALRDAVRDPAELMRLLDLPVTALGPAAATGFPLLVPRGFVARMRKGDPNDPLLKQVWPHAAELAPVAGFTADPVRERGLAAHGLIRKYPQRALLIASGACPIHCRYCFRREFPYGDHLASRGDWSQAIDELRAAGDVREAILSGGDPLSLSNRRLGELVARLADTSVATVRIHTRFPIAIPERVDAGLLRVLGSTRLRTVVVVHSNHANELDDDVAAALARLRPSLTALLNQSVLLHGVNDDADVLACLSERLFACGVLPYYLHVLDRVAGAAHFDVDETAAKRLVAALRARLPGYLVPRLVRETPGELGKSSLA
jgi:EF-P beta-lysylation protein EpmB